LSPTCSNGCDRSTNVATRLIGMTSIWTANWKSYLKAYKVRSQLLKSLTTIETRLRLQTVHEDPRGPSDRISELESENAALRRRLDTIEREMQSASPTKSAKKPQPDHGFSLGAENGVTGTTLYEKLNGMSLKEKRIMTPGKKIRKLTARKWDLMDENELDAYENF